MLRNSTSSICIALLSLCCAYAASGSALGSKLPGFDFRKPQVCSLWIADHDATNLRSTPDGLNIQSTGPDPYIHGPAIDLPQNQLLWMWVRLRPERAGIVRIYWYGVGRGAGEDQAIRIPVRAAVWQNIRIPVGAMGPGTSIRFDPPSGPGECTLQRLDFSVRALFNPPTFTHPARAPAPQSTFTVRSGQLSLTALLNTKSIVQVSVSGTPMAPTLLYPIASYEYQGTQRWVDIGGSMEKSFATGVDSVEEWLRAPDQDGAIWTLHTTFRPGQIPGVISVDADLSITKPRRILFAPLFILTPGAGTFGAHKQQALLSGVEYLGRDEPSSSEKDVIGPLARRTVPLAAQLTARLMAISAQNRWLALAWKPGDSISAMFDSPDRTANAGGHIMGLFAPGSGAAVREQGSIMPLDAVTLNAGQHIRLRAALMGGVGSTVLPAMQMYVRLYGLPRMPTAIPLRSSYVQQAAAGWLHSGIAGGGLFRHAVPGGFGPQPAADAAFWLQYLASLTPEPALAANRRLAAAAALAHVSPRDYNFAGVGHVRVPAETLLFGATELGLTRALENGRQIARQYAPGWRIEYTAPATGDDLSRTSSTKQSNGMSAQVVANLLQFALITQNAALKRQALLALKSLDVWQGSPPRGAQTWEVPLHTPDILAAAYLVKAYTLGYELTGRAALLNRAKAWAWSGVPFVYLARPASGPVGTYATIAVFGATHWRAPFWIGLPVQWCGAVYADAIARLALYDKSGPWQTIANGITLSGLQQSWPAGSDQLRQGLLPDSFNLQAQMRNDPAINPATLALDATRLLKLPTPYDYCVAREAGVTVQAAGSVKLISQSGTALIVEIRPWSTMGTRVLITGLRQAPKVTVNGAGLRAESVVYSGELGSAVVTVTVPSRIGLTW